jgi:hypothetical protein
MKYNISLQYLTANYDRVVYGDGAVSEYDYYGLYVSFIDSSKAVRKNKSRKSKHHTKILLDI